MLEAGALDVEVLEVGSTPDDEDDVGVVPGGERIALGDIELDEDAGLVLGDDGVALDVVREVEEVVLEADCVKEGLKDNGFALDVVRAVEDARLEADGVELGLWERLKKLSQKSTVPKQGLLWKEREEKLYRPSCWRW